MGFLIQFGLAVVGVIALIYAFAFSTIFVGWLFAKPRRIAGALALSFMLFFTVTMLVHAL